jgi:hypothetical protein
VSVGTRAILAIGGLTLMSCSTFKEPIPSVTITPDNVENPRRIRVEVVGNPFPPFHYSEDERRLPPGKRILIYMKRNVAPLLVQQGYCLNGFQGPEYVEGPENNRWKRFFFVECLPSKVTP